MGVIGGFILVAAIMVFVPLCVLGFVMSIINGATEQKK